MVSVSCSTDYRMSEDEQHTHAHVWGSVDAPLALDRWEPWEMLRLYTILGSRVSIVASTLHFWPVVRNFRETR